MKRERMLSTLERLNLWYSQYIAATVGTPSKAQVPPISM